mgnify:CR=1 FL=1
MGGLGAVLGGDVGHIGLTGDGVGHAHRLAAEAQQQGQGQGQQNGAQVAQLLEDQGGAKNWPLHLAMLVIVVVFEGINTITIPTPIGGISLLPMLFAMVAGLVLAEDAAIMLPEPTPQAIARE